MSQTYVVIGSNSFTGSHIVDALLQDPGRRVIGLSRSPEYKPFFLPYTRQDLSRFTFYQIDLVRRFDDLTQLLDTIRPAVVINVAALSEVALSHERPVEYFEINTLFVVRLCHYLRSAGYLRHYLHISSAEIFGSCETPVDETALFHPSTPYAVSKAAADLYLDTLLRHFDFPAALVRSTNVYGRHQQLFKIIPRTVIYLKSGRPIELHGGGQAMKSFIHIRDVVDGLLRILDRSAAGAFHFSVPSDQTVADVVRLVCTLMGHDFDQATRMAGERLGQDARYWLDCSRARRELDWAPTVPFERGVREVIEWIERYWDEIQHEPLVYKHKVS
jgi:dTDP-glucose 4,6-dehydratase